ncbi:hypothetical protein Dda_6503 [Drechslerella dactyloides]|uniref:Phosphatidylglycerol/phosphatidylinositol transfer protein n=1 Tax=Drechslerella dactyloides TaxID=74499 RepID=A0AAD6IXY2_DREDA|nr:hypothetical protein Dda_6503 [Drechslerella dactyloides]
MKFSNFLSASAAVVASVSAFAIDLKAQQPIGALGGEIPGGSPINHCSNPDTDLIQIDRIYISPNPPQRGQQLHFEASGIVKKRIEEGAYLKVDVIYNRYIHLIRNQTFDFCENIQKAEVDISCPIEEGPLTVVKEVDLPGEIPPGKFIVTAFLYTVNDEMMTCLHAETTFNRAS